MNNNNKLKDLLDNWKVKLYEWTKKPKCKHEYENIYCIDTGQYMYKQCKLCDKKKSTWTDE